MNNCVKINPIRIVHVKGMFRINLEIIPNDIASTKHGMNEYLKICSFIFFNPSRSKLRPALHKITQKEMFLSNEDVCESIDFPTIETTGTFLKNIPTRSMP